MAFEVLSKRYSKTDIPWCCSATVADRAVLKRCNHRRDNRCVQQPWQIRRFSNVFAGLRTEHPVQQPWQIRRFSNLWVWICRLIWAFLFQRTAKSARSSCFCDPPGRFFDRALGSPQASIPALTAVWIHYSKRLCQVAISAER